MSLVSNNNSIWLYPHSIGHMFYYSMKAQTPKYHFSGFGLLRPSHTFIGLGPTFLPGWAGVTRCRNVGHPHITFDGSKKGECVTWNPPSVPCSPGHPWPSPRCAQPPSHPHWARIHLGISLTRPTPSFPQLPWPALRFPWPAGQESRQLDFGLCCAWILDWDVSN